MRQRGRWDARHAFLGMALLLALALPAVAGERSFPSATHEEVWNLLTAEVARDRELTASGVNKARMNMIKERIAPDLARKERLLDDLSSARDPSLVRLREVLTATLADEKRIVEGGGTHRYQRFAERALAGNLAKKAEALAELEKEIAGGGSGY
ncbi:MAG: hypothetical protein HQK87_04480 [Nitrospinae bacterium]|nr:hypothetical protein [Nitrospinota bacterium]